MGAGTTGFSPGDKVYVSARELPARAGCYAEFIAVPARALFRLPPQVELEAAACLSNYQVAYHLLHTATRGAPGKTVLIDGAAGGLGSAAVQLAKLAGMIAIGLVSSDDKARALLQFGADHVINASTDDVAGRVAEFTGGDGVDLILDAVGGRKFADNLTMLAPFGLVVSYGRLQGPPEANVIAALENGPGYLNSTAVRVFTMHTLDDKPAVRAESMNYLIARLAEGAIHPLIHARLPLRDARRAHEMLEARQVIGKILLKP
jgi:NADPH2:quinone reductase